MPSSLQRIQNRRFLFLVLTVLGLNLGPLAGANADAKRKEEPVVADQKASKLRVEIDTDAATLNVLRGTKLVRSYKNISIGQYGAAPLHLRGDDTTPLGKYRIRAIDYQSRYRIFFALDYPNPEHARVALANGFISEKNYRAILSAHQNGLIPPSYTALGGAIGIHGVGAGDLSIHQQFNWTNGCVALDNEQIEDLSQWVGIGTLVTIR